MGKHKIIKSAAAVALTASVVATAAPGASAASYKTNAKDQLVHTSTGKLVKGWKVFGGKLYKNGKLAPAKKYKIIGTGAAQKLFYGPTLKKGYKTASSKTLLFKDGKLADGWKQAGKGERLYKNGKLDKGYTVYTNVEGDKFLYQNGYLKKGQKTANRGGETLLFVDGKLAKGYVLHEASKTLFNNGKVAEGLVKYPETDGKFYNDGKLANGEINGAEYKDGVLVAKDIASVKAINGTTVEVTFKEAQKADDVKAADYKIEGLEVKNAAVKQTDSKVVVLTTSAQEAAKEYTLVYKEADTKTFTGVSAVIPTAVKITKGSQQGVIGKEVTVEAQVTVAEGQSKAGIPVTIVVDSNKDTNGNTSDNIAKDYKVEVYTDENGVAKYSYTQYASNSEDTVTAYPTGDASVKSLAGKVYWGQTARLALTEVTAGNELANGSSKVYKVSSVENANGYINIAFKENVDVTPDKLVRNVKVTDATTPTEVTDAKVNGEKGAYPFQVTTGGVQYTQVKLDNNGEATFTLTGADAAVTPIVFADDGKYTFNVAGESTSYTGDNKYANTKLQAEAATVKFAAQATQQLAVEALGTANAADHKGANSVGGRDYKVTVKGTDGKLAPKGTKVQVTFKKDDVPAPNNVKLYGYEENGDLTAPKASNEILTLEVDAKGEVKFRVSGELNDFAKPTVFIDNSAPAGLDTKDLQTTAETTYFVKPVVNKAVLSVDDLDKKVLADKPATFTYTSLDQNGFPYATATNYVTTFEVAAKFADVTVSSAKGTGLAATDSTTGFVVKAGTTRTFTLTSAGTDAAIEVTTNGQPADVTVKASASQSSLPELNESVSFVSTGLAVPQSVLDAIIAAGKTGNVEDVKEALKNVDQYKALTAAQKDTAAANIFKEAKDNGTITSNKVLELIKEAPAAAALAKAKTDAKAELDTLAATKTPADYTVGTPAITQKVTAGKTAIDAATSTAAVTTVKNDAVSAINDVKSDQVLANEAAAAAKPAFTAANPATAPAPIIEKLANHSNTATYAYTVDNLDADTSTVFNAQINTGNVEITRPAISETKDGKFELTVTSTVGAKTATKVFDVVVPKALGPTVITAK